MISSDESAIKAWLHQRDQAAAAWLVNQHLSRVLHTARRWGIPPEMEQDLAQEIFLRMFKHLPLFRCDKPFAHWLSVITRNTCAKLRRHWHRRHLMSTVFNQTEIDLTHVALTHHRSPDSELTTREEIHRLHHALSQLRPQERQLIEQQASPDSNSSAPTPTSARTALSRARSKLRHILQTTTPPPSHRGTTVSVALHNSVHSVPSVGHHTPLTP